MFTYVRRLCSFETTDSPAGVQRLCFRHAGVAQGPPREVPKRGFGGYKKPRFKQGLLFLRVPLFCLVKEHQTPCCKFGFSNNIYAPTKSLGEKMGYRCFWKKAKSHRGSADKGHHRGHLRSLHLKENTRLRRATFGFSVVGASSFGGVPFFGLGCVG